jgi:hypothetical protein
MLETTIAGSLPEPVWLAEPDMLWSPRKLSGDGLAAASATRPEHFGVAVIAPHVHGVPTAVPYARITGRMKPRMHTDEHGCDQCASVFIRGFN